MAAYIIGSIRINKRAFIKQDHGKDINKQKLSASHYVKHGMELVQPEKNTFSTYHMK